MRVLFSFLLFGLALTFTGCDKEKSLLNDVSGEWIIALVDYQTTDGQLVDTDFGEVRLNFEPCTTEDNQAGDRCDLTVTRADGSQIHLGYNVLNTRTQGTRTLQIIGTDRNTEETESSLLHALLTGNYGFEVSGDQLTAVDSRNGATYRFAGQSIAEGKITFRRP